MGSEDIPEARTIFLKVLHTQMKGVRLLEYVYLKTFLYVHENNRIHHVAGARLSLNLFDEFYNYVIKDILLQFNTEKHDFILIWRNQLFDSWVELRSDQYIQAMVMFWEKHMNGEVINIALKEWWIAKAHTPSKKTPKLQNYT